MGVADLIFEPHPPNFGNQYNFWRCSNDVKMIFLISLLFSDFQRLVCECSVHICSCPWSIFLFINLHVIISFVVLWYFLYQIWYILFRYLIIFLFCRRNFFRRLGKAVIRREITKETEQRRGNIQTRTYPKYFECVVIQCPKIRNEFILHFLQLEFQFLLIKVISVLLHWFLFFYSSVDFYFLFLFYWFLYLPILVSIMFWLSSDIFLKVRWIREHSGLELVK